MNRVIALIPAAGRGLRMQSNIEKPYLTINDRPMLAHTLDAFDQCPAVDGYVLIVDPNRQDDCRRQIVDQYGYNRVIDIIDGGATRQESVYLGLQTLDPDTDVVVIHDGARPCVEPSLIMASVENCRQTGAVLAAVPVKDTVKVVQKGVIIQTLDRSTLWLAQTPQTFSYKVLMEAHNRAYADRHSEATDDAALVERIGHPVTVLTGNYENIKVTTPEDIGSAETILKRRKFLRN